MEIEEVNNGNLWNKRSESVHWHQVKKISPFFTRSSFIFGSIVLDEIMSTHPIPDALGQNNAITYHITSIKTVFFADYSRPVGLKRRWLTFDDEIDDGADPGADAVRGVAHVLALDLLRRRR